MYANDDFKVGFLSWSLWIGLHREHKIWNIMGDIHLSIGFYMEYLEANNHETPLVYIQNVTFFNGFKIIKDFKIRLVVLISNIFVIKDIIRSFSRLLFKIDGTLIIWFLFLSVFYIHLFPYTPNISYNIFELFDL